MEISKIIIGAMRFPDRSHAVDVIHRAIDLGFNYIDTSPVYCRQSEEENSESWVGEAVNHPDYRSRVLVSTKCTPGTGGLDFDDNFRPEGGFGCRSKEQMQQVYQQSLKRLNMDKVDYYHLWTTHTHKQFAEAMKDGGWYDGAKEIRAAGGFIHLGITTHADTDTVIDFLESGFFETVTIPLNVINRTRTGIVDYCREKGIKVFAMNPFAGGFLTKRDDLKELSLRYLLSMEGVHPLIGFAHVEEVEYAKHMLDTMKDYPLNTEQIIEKVAKLVDSNDPRCTSCGYCTPCPQWVNLGACLSYYNAYKYLGIEQAKDDFLGKQWESGLRLDNCTGCMACQKKCPNDLPLDKIIPAAKEALYGKAVK